MFTVFVAIDLSGGRVVRLTRGDPEAATVYGEDPVATALAWQERGATWLHVVDLDGAITGDPSHAAVIRRVLQAVEIPVQVAGGIRSVDAVERWLEAGAARVCVGTRAVEEGFLSDVLARFRERVVAAVDARGGTVQLAGWRESSSLVTGEVVDRLRRAGVARILFTDIGRDGTLEGPNLPAIEEVLDASGSMGVIASGGVARLADVEALVPLAGRGLEGVVVGRALYSGALRLGDALVASGAGRSPI
ncbi:MAG TPA: 1-(5-phosphoribosyl)-5-[(5-phosphoribosylamino)methylideneamino]imidazole-4-carboxamide isomerase [Actinomycetota bacterium]|nr:1-(5-phosphoribosyl)-5-[(5-phosphoribosylamino)methylideneamino]imidazole-4-carboxamide isomerase [Actinomycetota bacterium]